MKFYIDGSNLLCLGKQGSPRNGGESKDWVLKKRKVDREGRERVHYSLVNPRLDIVEALAARLIEFGHTFKIYFDVSAQYHFRDADQRGEGKNFVNRFNRLIDLGTSLAQGVETGQADDPMLSEASADFEGPGSVFIVSNDNFKKIEDGHYEKYSKIFEHRGPKGHPNVLVKSHLIGEENTEQHLLIVIPGVNNELLCRIRVEPVDLATSLQNYRSTNAAGQPDTTVEVAKMDNETAVKRETELKKRDGMRVTVIKSRDGEFARDGFFLRSNLPRVKVGKFGAAAANLGHPWPIYIGCDPTCDIVIDPEQKYVSGQHLAIDRIADGSFVVTDRSRNGTFLGTSRLVKDKPTPLPLDVGVISLIDISGDSDDAIDFVFEIDERFKTSKSPFASSTAQSSSRPQTSKASTTQHVLSTIHFEFANGKRTSQSVPSFPFSIGTEPTDCGFCLSEDDAYGVSRRHLLITQAYKDQGVLVENHGRNPTTLGAVVQGKEFIWLFTNTPWSKDGQLILADVDAPHFQPVKAWISRQE